ncbi:unnamed protein product [Gongylonema pulchrum]|uniref:GED domain-containing protein n=1 Tax=Gongylonema pulchrum TaxID=637853 RepID=A0A183E7H7_9BILA|nr:unnamed protein product [Gongylonema pulchrum]
MERLRVIFAAERIFFSKTVIGIADLIEKTLKEAAAAESETVAAKTIQTCYDIIDRYIVTAPHIHEVAISSVPLVAAVFYNNCYYISHRLMLIMVKVLPKLQSAFESKNLRVLLVDFIPRLRLVAADSMEKQLMHCRHQLSTLLADDKIFIGLDDVSRHEQCRKCLDGCMMQLEKISGIWKKLVLSMEDIRANDAELCALALSKVLKECELLVDRSGHSPINKKVELEFCRMHEVVFCLEASLQFITQRSHLATVQASPAPSYGVKPLEKIRNIGLSVKFLPLLSYKSNFLS